jgi:hypothetical protein
MFMVLRNDFIVGMCVFFKALRDKCGRCYLRRHGGYDVQLSMHEQPRAWEEAKSPVEFKFVKPTNMDSIEKLESKRKRIAGDRTQSSSHEILLTEEFFNGKIVKSGLFLHLSLLIIMCVKYPKYSCPFPCLASSIFLSATRGCSFPTFFASARINLLCERSDFLFIRSFPSCQGVVRVLFIRGNGGARNLRAPSQPRQAVIQEAKRNTSKGLVNQESHEEKKLNKSIMQIVVGV